MPNRTVNHNNRNRAAYQVDGNTVRRMEAMPDYRKERRGRQEREREEELRKRRRAAARNQEKALRMSKSYVVFLTIFGVFCGAYIKLQSDVTARMKAIASLESQVTDLKADNDEAYKRINTAVDLDAIKEKAIDELGMFYATQDQIVYYSVDKTDYMNQYNEIPQ